MSSERPPRQPSAQRVARHQRPSPARAVELAQARRLLALLETRALTFTHEFGAEIAVADALTLLGYVAVGQRNVAGARALFAGERHERAVSAVRATLDDAAFDAARAAGQTLALDDLRDIASGERVTPEERRRLSFRV